jgi:serine/threonine protein phosphatase PrpC
MDFVFGYATDKGIKKNVNQDSLCIKRARIEGKDICMAVLCDGMGGLSSGELASGTVIKYISDWFLNELPKNGMFLNSNQIRLSLANQISTLNQRIFSYGQKNNIQMGTTLTLILMIEGSAFVAHVGDSRLYGMTEAGELNQLTEDQSLVAREVKMGRLTPEQAEVDPRKNVLLQCVGGALQVESEIFEIDTTKYKGFLLCSDGFRHVVSKNEMENEISGLQNTSKESINEALTRLIELNKQRGEKDNITSIYIEYR